MPKNKSSLSKATSYFEIGEFWDTHDVADYWDKTEVVDMEVDIQSKTRYYPVEKELSFKLQKTAQQRGVSAATLLNLWIQEKLHG